MLHGIIVINEGLSLQKIAPSSLEMGQIFIVFK
jgi:hypothetical protein